MQLQLPQDHSSIHTSNNMLSCQLNKFSLELTQEDVMVFGWTSKRNEHLTLLNNTIKLHKPYKTEVHLAWLIGDKWLQLLAYGSVKSTAARATLGIKLSGSS